MNEDDPSGQKKRIAEFREKIKSLSFEELVALSAILKRGTADFVEEIKVLAEQMAANRAARLKQKGTGSDT